VGSINYYLNENILKMYFGIYMIMVFDPQILWNDGFYPLVEVRLPERSLLRPAPPAALSCRTHALGRVFDVLGGLLGQHQPHFLNGAGFSSSPHLMYSGRYEDGEWFQLYQIGFGGVPGRRIGDGPDGHSMWPSFTNVPNEYLERYYPLRIERYTSVIDSGGAGLHRGGNGVEVAYRFLRSGDVSIHDDRWFTHPWGANGGQPGSRSTKILERADGSREVLPSKCDNVFVEAGDLLRYITWGGGGWGDPLERDPELVAREVARGLVSVEGARSYGVVLSDAGDVDDRATEQLRAEIRAERPALQSFDLGPGVDKLRLTCFDETGLPAPARVGANRPAGVGRTATSTAVGTANAPLLRGKVALVTGASSGIGQASAVALAEAGARVVIGTFDGDPHDAEVTRELIKRIGGEAIVVHADVRSTADIEATCDLAIEHWGRLDIAVANAAILRTEPLHEITDDMWAGVMDVNLTGVMRTCRAAAARMLEGGSIVTISSIAGGIFGWPDHSHYATAKASVVGLTKSLAAELGPLGIRVNVVLPGLIQTQQPDSSTSVASDGLAQAVGSIPLQRIGVATDVASVVSFLASDGSDYVTGQGFVVDGGRSARLNV
jgi:NAD(P)-dependent dehydrogenase (short-subunit alcohol dehydrogenase family)